MKWKHSVMFVLNFTEMKQTNSLIALSVDIQYIRNVIEVNFLSMTIHKELTGIAKDAEKYSKES